jgi:acetolactate synthase-1/2/3 large subunit
MPKPITQRKEPNPSPAAGQRWGSDVIVDMLHHYELPYAALNPGASYRGLHDSMVNYGNRPYMMLCQHEETAVQIAHGYAKATASRWSPSCTTSSACSANLAVYYAYVDRVRSSSSARPARWTRPGVGPVSTGRTRPSSEPAVRDYTKWDYQPTVVDGVPESFARASAS